MVVVKGFREEEDYRKKIEELGLKEEGILQ